MKLFLASKAIHPESIKKLQKFSGGLAGKKIAYVPTAANGEFIGSWKAGSSYKVARKLSKNVQVVELEDYRYKDIITPLKQTDIIWMAGGMSGYLLYWIRRAELDKTLPIILESGTLYVGSSAGSMICATTQSSAEWYLGEPEPGAHFIPGLGLVDFEIYPHYEDDQLPEIKKYWQKGKLALLKNGEAITVENGKVTFLGEERIIEK